MAREHARILCGIWGDDDWREVSPEGQRLYFLLLSQKNINNAGVLPLQPTKWARGSKHTTVDDVLAAMKELEETRYIVVDLDTEEVLVRTFVRNDGVVKVPNVLKSAFKHAVQVESPRLRLVLAGELRRLGLSAADRVAEQLDPKGSRTVSEPVANGSPMGSRTHDDVGQSAVDSTSERKTSRTRPEGFPEPRGEGEGEGEGEPSAVGHFGGSHARAHTREEPPPPRCPQHENADGDPGPCRACGQARRDREAWDGDADRREAARRSAEAREVAELRARAIARCDLCDERGYRGRTLCDHDPEALTRGARGSAAVRAELDAALDAAKARRRESTTQPSEEDQHVDD